MDSQRPELDTSAVKKLFEESAIDQNDPTSVSPMDAAECSSFVIRTVPRFCEEVQAVNSFEIPRQSTPMTYRIKRPVVEKSRPLKPPRRNSPHSPPPRKKSKLAKPSSVIPSAVPLRKNGENDFGSVLYSKIICRKYINDGNLKLFLQRSCRNSRVRNTKVHVVCLLEAVIQEPTKIGRLCEALQELYKRNLVTDDMLGEVFREQFNYAEDLIRVVPEYHEHTTAIMSRLVQELKSVTRIEVDCESTSF